MDDELFQRLRAKAAAASPEPKPLVEQASPVEPAATSPAMTPAPNDDPASPEYQAWQAGVAAGPLPEPGLGSVGPEEAVLGGAFKSIFETKDFFTGEAAPEDRSEFRRNVEGTVRQQGEQSAIYGLTASSAQLFVGLLGAGKMVGALGVGATAGKWAKVTAESLKSAAAGMVSFDPYEARISNYVQGTALANPITEFLAADPEDGVALARFKVVLESIGMDAAVIGVMAAGSRGLKFLRRGDYDKAAQVLNEAQDAAAKDLSPPAPKATPAPAAGTPTVTVASDTAEANAALGNPAMTPRKPKVRVKDEDTKAILDGMRRDAEAIDKHGNWSAAINAGHTFGAGEGIPYAKLGMPEELDYFMARVADQVEEQIDKVRGGTDGVLKDTTVDRLTRQWASIYNEDPMMFLGAIQRAGNEARKMASLTEAGLTVTRRMFQDAHALAARIQLGDFTQFGSEEAAHQQLNAVLDMASSVYASTKAMIASGGRTVRRQNPLFQVKGELVEKLAGINRADLLDLIGGTQGDVRMMTRILQPTTLEKLADAAQFLYINNLVSGPWTQAINISTTAYMVGSRTLERIVGGAIRYAKGDLRGARIAAAGLKQYHYMGTALGEAFSAAKKGFLRNDSILAPHRSELVVRAAQGAASFKPMLKPEDLIHNALAAVYKLGRYPTRVLGGVDEFMKQIVYRSKVQADAYIEAHFEAAARELSGEELTTYVKKRVSDALGSAFDSKGRGVLAGPLHEAHVATFQEALAPGTVGKWFSEGTSNIPAMKYVLPFVRTPTNVMRYGWKLTPGLQFAQTEFRNAFLGKLGGEAQAQAYGQFTLSMLYLAGAAHLVASGKVTGGGPTDPRKAEALRATGWRPYSFAVQGEGGKTEFIQFNRMDPVAMPLGMVADITDAMHALDSEEDSPGVGDAIGALAIAVAKQFTSKTYLVGVSDFLEAVTNADDNGAMASYLNRLGSNMIPYSSAMRQLNGDPLLREARDLSDKLMATVPGLSDNVPARYDAWGEPILARRGPWTEDTGQLVDEEVQRMVLTGDHGPSRVSPYVKGVDLRDHTMADGRNAFEAYQQLSGRPTPEAMPLKEAIAKVMQSEGYQAAPDGDIATPGTRMAIIAPVMSRYRAAAMRVLEADPSVGPILRRRKMKVIEHYTSDDPKRPVAKTTTDTKGTLGDLGRAYGVDLDGLLND